MAEGAVDSDESSGGLEVGDDVGVGVQNLLPFVAGGRCEPSRFVHRREDREVLPLTGQEVVLAMARRRVHEARAGVHGHVFPEDDAEGPGLLLGGQLAAHLR
jgi:hypothetical protein